MSGNYFLAIAHDILAQFPPGEDNVYACWVETGGEALTSPLAEQYKNIPIGGRVIVIPCQGVQIVSVAADGSELPPGYQGQIYALDIIGLERITLTTSGQFPPSRQGALQDFLLYKMSRWCYEVNKRLRPQGAGFTWVSASLREASLDTEGVLLPAGWLQAGVKIEATIFTEEV